MLTDEYLIEKTKKLYENSTGWGDSNDWTNQDFVILSEKIQEKTGEAISHVTLKRVWGKVKYESLPNTHTLDTLVKFLGYESWRNFKSQSGNGAVYQSTAAVPEIAMPFNNAALTDKKHHRRGLRMVLLIGFPLLLIVIILLVLKNRKPVVRDDDYSFSSKTIVTEGLPNSVVFYYDASKSPYDSVIIQQSWDRHLQAKVSKKQHQHTSIYYYPDYFKAKLIVGGRIVKMHRLLIKSNGWLPIVTQSPVPVYFKKEDAMINGKMALSVDNIHARNIKMQPQPPTVLYANVRDFGPIYSDDFVFETSVKNNYKEGAAICQSNMIYLLCEGTAIGIPLCAKGCISDINLFFTNFNSSGKQEDLSAFGVDFDAYVKLRIESKNRIARIFINDKMVYQIKNDIIKAKIIGIDYSFLGTGSVDYVKLTNSKVNYRDDF